MMKLRAYWDKLRKKIKKEQEGMPCWKCKHFDGYYFDGVTFTCKVEGDNWMWDFVEKDCANFKEIKGE